MTLRMRNKAQNQSGMVAIPVTIILMIVISLITIGFSTTVRKEQRQALDSQLASQAFYAAESGINIAAQKLNDPSNSSLTKSDCGPSGPFNTSDYTINGSGISDAYGTTITCLLIKPVNDLQFTSVGGTSKVSLIDTGGVTNINSIYINWQSTSGNVVTTCNLANTFPTAEAWSSNCSQPIIRLDIVPISNSMSTVDLRSQQFTAFLYPKKTASGGTAANFATGLGSGKGAILDAGCNESTDSNKTQRCMIGLNTVTPVGNKFAIRIISLYGNSDVRVHVRGAGNSQPDLKNAQALVDSTARSLDVLRRVQVRIPLVDSSNVPDFALSAGQGICKQYSVSANSVTNTNPACDF